MGNGSSVHSASKDSLAASNHKVIRSEFSPIEEDPHYVKKSHNDKLSNSKDSEVTHAESELHMQYFELINDDLRNKSDILRDQPFERQLYIRFIKENLWKNKISPEFRRILAEASNKHLTRYHWQLTTQTPSIAKQIYQEEISLDNSIHSTTNNHEALQYFTEIQLQSMLIVCTLKSFFTMRSYLDFTIHSLPLHSINNPLNYSSFDDINDSSNLYHTKNNNMLIGQLDLIPLFDDEVEENRRNNLPNVSNSEKSAIYLSNSLYEEEYSDDHTTQTTPPMYLNDPEMFLVSISQETKSSELDDLLISGQWMNILMQLFENLPLQINLFQIHPLPTSLINHNTSFKLSPEYTCLYSNYQTIGCSPPGSKSPHESPRDSPHTSQSSTYYTPPSPNYFDPKNISFLSRQIKECMFDIAESKQMHKEIFWDKQNITSKPLFVTFLPLSCQRINIPNDFLTWSSSNSNLLSSQRSNKPQILDYNCVLTLHLDAQTLYSTRSLYDSLDFLLFVLSLLI